MERHLVTTGDGSHSLFVPALNEQYHSRHGALQESRHVFIEMGLRKVAAETSPIRILEIGFGTGLNALLTALVAANEGLEVEYWTVEAYPLEPSEVAALNYVSMMDDPQAMDLWQRLHAADWETNVPICPTFQLHKLRANIEDFVLPGSVNLIYFDAFAPEKQPELWTTTIFEKMYGLLQPHGILTTYCAKGAVRRTLHAAGFQVKKEKGPPGKREMMVAFKD
jgi:tRNA U34 5-methylaminomethyl-2-thiouridine-forming methyltransferase MnmC